jgi:FtsH-binding integral membrane protein
MQPQPMTRYGYCERLSDAFWAEPLNAVSNAAFILAALAGWLWLSRADRRDLPATLLIALVFAIGVGSFLFHTMPQRWTLLADVIPIQLFSFLYFGLALRRYLGLPLLAAGLGTLAFLAAAFALNSTLAPLLPAAMRGSAGYAAFVLALLGMALAARFQGKPAVAGLLLAAGVVFAISLTLRSLDDFACRNIPFGLHWAWHLLNACVLALLLRAAIGHGPAPAKPAPG